MKRYLLLLLTVILFGSCRNVIVEKETYDNGNIKSVKTYKTLGQERVLLKEELYHENGTKSLEGNYKDNLRDGYWATWFDNGGKWSIGEYRKGENHGKRMVYQRNGTLYYEGIYDMGKRTGVWRFYDESGKLMNEIDYERHQPNKNKTR